MKTTPAADYYRTQLANPLTKFLDLIPRGEELRTTMNKTLPPLPDESVRAFRINERLRLNANVGQFHLALGRDIELAEMVLDLLEVSYTARRPTPTVVAERKKIAEEIAELVLAGGASCNEAIGRALIGTPGSGKTRTVNRVLAQIPQIVTHDLKLHPLLLPKMVTWIRVEAPANRKLSALAANIITAIGAAVRDNFNSLKRGNISDKIQNAAMLCMEFHVGVIVIDEIQHVLRKSGEPDLELLNFLVELSNRVNLPLLLIGTPQAEFVVAGAMRQARRMFGPPWSPLARGSPPWTKFAERLLGYQFTRQAAEVAELEPKLFELSQGLPAIAVTLYQFAQKAALLIELESGQPTKITPAIMDKAFQRYMRTVAPMLEALRSGNESEIAMYQDLKVDAKAVKAMLVDLTDERKKHRERKLMRLTMGVAPRGKGQPHSWRSDAN